MLKAHALTSMACFVVSGLGASLASHSSTISLPLARHFNVTGMANIAEADRARAKLLRSKAAADLGSESLKRSVFNVPITNEAVSYSVSVGIGTPAIIYSLMVDTSSAVTWVGAGKPYVQTATSEPIGDRVLVDTDGTSLSGEGFFDTVEVGQMVVPHQFIAVVSTSPAGFDNDGGLGLGSVLSDEPGFPVNPSIVNNAFVQGLLNDEEVGFFFEPTTSLSITNGELTFGGIDSSKIVGSLQTVPITSTSPSSTFVGINQQVTYGTGPVALILSDTAGIVDAGTTLVLLASDAFARYKAAVGAVPDNNTGLLKITPAQFTNLKSLFFNINGVFYEFTNNAQIWPRALNTAIGGNSNSIYLIVSDLGTTSGQGLDFINGFTFMERFYTVYNSAEQTFGIAKTPFTFATTN